MIVMMSFKQVFVESIGDEADQVDSKLRLSIVVASSSCGFEQEIIFYYKSDVLQTSSRVQQRM